MVRFVSESNFSLVWNVRKKFVKFIKRLLGKFLASSVVAVYEVWGRTPGLLYSPYIFKCLVIEWEGGRLDVECSQSIAS